MAYTSAAPACGRLGPALGHFQYAIPAGFRAPAVVTIHDLSFERDRAMMGLRDRLIFRTVVPRAAARAATRVLTVSERTRRDLIEHYGLPEDKIVVTPNGVDPAFGPDGPKAGGSPYALFVGALQPRKDPVSAVEAIALGRRGFGSSSPGPTREAARLCGRRSRGWARGQGRPARVRRAGAAGRPLPRRCLPRLPVPVRGLRPARGRGDGLLALPSSRRGRAPCPRWRGTQPSSSSPAARRARQGIEEATGRP